MTHVLYVGPFAQHTGYAQAGHDYLLAMFRAGISLEIQPIIACNTDDLQERYAELLPLVRGMPGHVKQSPTHVIVHTVPAYAHRFVEGAPKGVKLICMTTWETSELPAELHKQLDENFDEIWVPSEFCWDVMHRDTPVKYKIVPHTFDSLHWWVPERADAGETYRFYSVLSWCERKNPIGLLKAYWAEFSLDDDVELLIKCQPNQADISALIQVSGIPSDLPPVRFVSEQLDHDEMIEFHEHGHCFVTAARGEGWNLPAFEAAIVGNPVITPMVGGQCEFLSDYYGAVYYPQSWTPAVAPPIVDNAINLGGVSVRAVKQVAPGGISMRQYWGEPDLKQLAKAMRGAVSGRWWKSKESLSWLEANFGYAVVGQKIKEMLG